MSGPELGGELAALPTPEILRRHDAVQWMDWSAGEAVVVNGGTYEAQMSDGQAVTVTARVWAEDDLVLLNEASEDLSDLTRIPSLVRLRKVLPSDME